MSRSASLALCLTWLLSGHLAGQRHGVIFGSVRDSSGRALLAEVFVVPGSPSARASDGRYLLTGVRAGTVRLVARALGYARVDTLISVRPGDSLEVDFVLRWNRDPLFADTFQLAPLIVTAAKRSQLIEEAFTSVAIISSQELAARAVNTVDEAVDRAPAVQLINGQINIRGSSGYVQGLGARVLLLVDGVPVNQGDRGGINWDILPLDQVERVEILKGAGSALYGSAALGGVVNLITRPIATGLHFRVRGTGGIYADPPHEEWIFREDPGLQAGGDVTASYGIGPFRGSLAAGGRYSDGYREQDSRDHWQLAGRGEWHFSPESALRVSGSWAADDYEVPLTWCTRGRCDDRGQAYQPFRVDTTELGARTYSAKGYLTAVFARIPSPRLRWQARTSWVRTRFSDDRRTATEYSIADRYGAELQAEAHPSAERAVTVGAEATRSEIQSDIFGAHTLGEYATYGESEQTVAGARLTFGARMDFLTVDGGGLSAVVSPRVGLVWPRVWGAWRMSLGRGFRSPTLAERFVRTRALGFEVIPNPTLVPETSWSFEVGNTAPVSERLRVDIAGFWTEASRLIEPAIIIDEDGGGAPLIQFQNVSRALIAGVDVAVTASPFTQRFRGTLAYTWLHARERARDTLPERPLAFRPQHLLTLSGDYALEPFTVGADWRYMSRIERVEIYPDDPRIAAVVLDLRASYRRTPLEIHARVANALNHIHSLVPRTLAPVRTATVTLTWTY